MEEVAGAAEGVAEGGMEGGGPLSLCASCFESITSCVFTICCIVLVPIILIIVLVWNFVIRTADAGAESVGLDDFSNVLDNLEVNVNWPEILGQEPGWAGDTGSAREWRTQPGVQGLQLELYNALDSTWQDIFDQAVSDWDESEALALSTTDVAVDRECTFVDGVMKVCNANYGETGWVGLNEVELLDDYIIASVSKMNEYYLRNADYAKRRYTMCHELGHGFGLPHTDEDPYNRDLGNCLDYTDSPENNYLPGQVNFEKLRNLYLLNETSDAASSLEQLESKRAGDVPEGTSSTNLDDGGGGTRRGLRRVVLRQYLHAGDLHLN